MSHMPKTLGVITLVAAAGPTLAGCGTSASGSPTVDARTTARAAAITSTSAASQYLPEA